MASLNAIGEAACKQSPQARLAPGHQVGRLRTAKILSEVSSVMPRSWMLARVVMSPQAMSPQSCAMASPSYLSCLADSSPFGTCVQGRISIRAGCSALTPLLVQDVIYSSLTKLQGSIFQASGCSCRFLWGTLTDCLTQQPPSGLHARQIREGLADYAWASCGRASTSFTSSEGPAARVQLQHRLQSQGLHAYPVQIQNVRSAP